MDTGYYQVVRGPLVGEDADSGVGADAGEGVMTGLGLVTEVLDDGGRRGYWGQGIA